MLKGSPTLLKTSHESLKKSLEDKAVIEDVATTVVNYYDSDAENEANLIAYELLMPKHMVEELMSKGLTPEEMADRFYVAPSVMTLRLLDLYPGLMII